MKKKAMPPMAMTAGQCGRILFNFTLPEGTAMPELVGALMVHGQRVDMVRESEDRLLIPVCPPGVYLAEVRAAGVCVLYGHVEVLPSPLYEQEGVVCYTIDVDAMTDVLAVSLSMVEGIPGPRGEQGEKGEKGDTGETGPQGPQGELSEEDAARIAGAAQVAGDNTFSGNNSHGGSEVFNGAVALNGTVDATAAAMQLPVEVLRTMSAWPGLMGPACTEVAMLGPMFGSSLEDEVLVLNCPNLSNVSFSSTGLINSTLTGSGGRYDGRFLCEIGIYTARVIVSIAPTVLTGREAGVWKKLEEAYILVTQGNYGRDQLPRSVFLNSNNFPKLRKLVIIAPFAKELPLQFSDNLNSVLDELVFIMPKMPTLEGTTSGMWTRILANIRGCSRARVYLPALKKSLTIDKTQMDAASVVFLLNGLPTVEEPPLTVTLGVGAGVLAGTDENGGQIYADETLTAAVAAAAEKGWSVQLVDNSNAY